jgi:hypothetical protein
VRVPVEILTSIVAAVSAFVLPVALLSIHPTLQASPEIEPLFEEREERVVQLEKSEPTERSTPNIPKKEEVEERTDHASTAPAAASRQEPAEEPKFRRPFPAHASLHARVAADYPKRPGRALASTPRKTKRRRPCVEPTQGITQTSAQGFDVERSLVDYYTTHPHQAERLAQTSWHRKNGKIDGFRVKKVRCDSPLHQLGFRNGDVVHSVDGQPITSLTQALRAFRKLRKNNSLRIRTTTRRGETKELRFRVI